MKWQNALIVEFYTCFQFKLSKFELEASVRFSEREKAADFKVFSYDSAKTKLTSAHQRLNGNE